MFESFEVHSSLRDYSVRVGANLLDSHLLQHPDALILSDARIAVAWPALGDRRVIAIEADESKKNLSTVADVIERMREFGANRQTVMIAVGGGIVQDIATFVASSYMRGIRWTYMPTTLLGMVDSCLGGKSSINVGQFKNIAGNYYPPWEIVIDTEFCRTLPQTQRIAGLCEAAKICFADRDAAFDRYLALLTDVGALDRDATLPALVSLSLSTKKKFIEQDEFDQGIRLLLNFGHTFGHAIEAASSFAVSHGVAVGIGTLAALQLSESLGICDGTPTRVGQLKQHMLSLLRSVPRLEAELAKLSPSDALTRFKADKKHRQDAYAAILVDADGQLERRFLPINPRIEAQVENAFEYATKVLHEVQ